MRLPALAITGAFAIGIALGLHPLAVKDASSLPLLFCWFSIAAALILSGIILIKMERLVLASAASLLCWGFLGFLGACISDQPRPADHVIALLEQGRINLDSPLRWRGHLRDEPTRLPWGFGYDIELSGVEYEGTLRSVRGGLRLSFTPHAEEFALPELHAGDEVAVVTEARRPQIFRDNGAFDRRTYLAEQNIDLVATLRAPQLIERLSSPAPTFATRLARARRDLREETVGLFAGTPQVAGALRAMLLGDRSFVDRAEAADFQKTGVFHVLVVAGLHVGALAITLYWLGRRLRLSPVWTIFFVLTVLFAYVAVVEQRLPVLRAATMAAIVVLGRVFFRRLELLNSAALAALLLLVAKPLALGDSSFQLSFVAIGCIAGLAVPWLEKTAEPYARALRGWRDVTRDATHEPRAAQFRIDLRALAQWLSTRLPQPLGKKTGDALVRGLSLSFRGWELLVITVTLQVGMLPMMARDFHRVTLSGPIANLAAVPLTGLVVPLGFLTLAAGMVLPAAGRLLAKPLALLTAVLLHIVQWFAHFPRWSYRIPGSSLWLILLFFSVAALVAAELRFNLPRRRILAWGLRSVWIACALAVAIYPFGIKWTKGKLEIDVLDVGQGDSLFVVFPGGRTLLIDGGGAFGGFQGNEEHYGTDPGEEAVSPYLWSRGFQKLDAVALTHAHQDHLGGLTAILENFQVGRLWIGREVSSSALARLEELARQKKIPVEHELRGKSFSWDGVEGEFLWPPSRPEEIAPEAKNNDSLVLRLHFRNRTFLLPGDAEKESESALLSQNSGDALRADVLKVGHHGSKNSTTPEFLAVVQPRLGIISAGEANPYGHPHAELLERLEKAGVRVLRTDQDGMVQVTTDGARIDVNCFVTCPDAANRAASVQTETPDHKQHGENE